MSNNMKKFFSISTIIMALLFLTSCHDMKVGYLKTENAVYVPDTVVAYQEVDEEYDPHAVDNSPWTSMAIQGVAGTVPITYEFYDVQATDGGDANAFRQAVKDGNVRLQGSLIQMFLAGAKQVPEGRYTVSLKVCNEDHEAILPSVFTFIVKKSEWGEGWDDDIWF